MSDSTRPRPDIRQVVAIVALIGALVTVGLLVWQRVSYGRLIADLRGKLTATRSIADASSNEVQDLQARLDASEASATVLAGQNAQLAADLARARDELEAKNPRPVIIMTERHVSPSVVMASNSLDLSVKVRGRATKVQMKLVGPTGAPDTQVYDLVRYSTSGGVDTWQRSVTAPWKPGEYKYYASAFVEDLRYEMLGDNGFTFTVR